MNERRTIRVGTRRSRLALAQADLVIGLLRAARPGREFEVVGIVTSGDRLSAEGPLPEGKGIFTREIESALLAGKIDMAVHSLKDLPTEMPAGLRIGAVPARGRPEDALISRDGAALAALKPGAVVGTGSPRRAAQLLAARPDLTARDIRGNVDTRLRKLDEGRFDAIILAYAGLERLGLAGRISETLPAEIMTPAPGQGALAVEIRIGDAEMAEFTAAIHCEASAARVAAERAVLKALGGGCRNPVGALADIMPDGGMRLRAVTGVPGGRLVRAVCAGGAGGVDEAERLGRRAVEELAELLDNRK